MSFKKNRDQTFLLDEEFDRNPNWSKAKMSEIANKLGLKDSQVYKWHWDRSQTVHKRFQKTLRKINSRAPVGVINKTSPLDALAPAVEH
jgi:uncharacterized protein YjcR